MAAMAAMPPAMPAILLLLARLAGGAHGPARAIDDVGNSAGACPVAGSAAERALWFGAPPASTR